MNEGNEARTRVLIVAPSPDKIGGQAIQARRLIEAFDGNPEIELTFLPNDPPTPFSGMKYLRTVAASIRFWISLLIQVSTADVVHVFSAGMSGYVIATLPPLIVSRIFGVPAVLNYHSGELREHIEHWPQTSLPTMRRFQRVVVPSEFLVAIFADYGIRARAIFNFVDSDRFAFRKREPLRPVFLSNRNFEPHYNVADCLRAFRIIRERFSEARLIVAGHGSQESELKELAAELGPDGIEFVGRVEPAEMPALYDRADVFLNSSVVDNMPLSIIESFAAGLPVVTYATGGIPYLVDHQRNGLLVDKPSPVGLANAAIRLLDDAKLAAGVIENARADVAKYSFESVRQDWVDFYTKLGSV